MARKSIQLYTSFPTCSVGRNLLRCEVLQLILPELPESEEEEVSENRVERLIGALRGGRILVEEAGHEDTQKLFVPHASVEDLGESKSEVIKRLKLQIPKI